MNCLRFMDLKKFLMGNSYQEGLVVYSDGTNLGQYCSVFAKITAVLVAITTYGFGLVVVWV